MLAAHKESDECLDTQMRYLLRLKEQTKIADESKSQMEKMRLEQKRLLEEFGQNKAVLDAVNLKEQEKLMNQIEKRNDECPICKEEILDRAHPNNCTHDFCFGCIKRATIKKSTCPYCRKECTRIDRERGPSIRVKSSGFGNPNREQEFLGS